jgi:hypothetical protein
MGRLHFAVLESDKKVPKWSFQRKAARELITTSLQGPFAVFVGEPLVICKNTGGRDA